MNAVQRLAEAARDPRDYVASWRAAHPGGKVLGVLPMNFPRELAHAAGVLPVIVPDDRKPVSEGRSLLPEFYCGYTRNLVDQSAGGRFDLYDAVFTVDHCIQLVGAADVVRALQPETPVFFEMLATSLSDPRAAERIDGTMAEFRRQVEELAGVEVTDAALRASIIAFDADRSLLRQLLDDRAAGDARWTPGDLQVFIASAMVMDPVDHLALLHEAIAAGPPSRDRDERVRVHLSGHLCHAPKRELLEVIEEAGAVVVDDDLWTGRRYVSTDVGLTDDGDLLAALGAWYQQRNSNLPCPTRVQHDADWDTWLVDATRRSGAEAVVHLMPKFCEPHMLMYPELRKRLDAEGIPQLLVETEHEGIPLESFRTRVEALVERALRKRPAYA